ncbi:ABC transporter permease [Methylovirgula sp. 4M-Z18]|uniref:ABC transporter permease n=1 Tax=Methylovirgula sp. 4M-Z18 TaxID=2293567 RepID=UPI000E2F9689|nr:MlaE family lipid ABC transporter permease subunit [Methylovirgula sp. 4M-Z18]RFB80080.1 MlaE family lipid ABC transporter permease subunit [Methylovirgula sp. 4M-Z18]
MEGAPSFSVDARDASYLTLSGAWVAAAAKQIETVSRHLVQAAANMPHVTLDLSGIEHLDMAGAWVIERAHRQFAVGGGTVTFVNARREYAQLLDEVSQHDVQPAPPPPHGNHLVTILADIGAAVVISAKDLYNGQAFLGQVAASLFKMVFNPLRFRMTPLVYHVESFAFHSVPIIVLINFLVGCIVAQQGIFQSSKYGATIFTVDLIGILICRELGVLLTSIMMAGRTGSAITAEVGSMKMREEVDALQVMGLDPVEVLVVPRVVALMISLPMLTFLADMAAIFGGLLVVWFYGGIGPDVFASRLQQAIALNTFLAGIIKAPFMALVIGLISAVEGLAVQGSAESLGRQVTASVVKSIFMVIVVDGLFAMFFAAIRY